MIVCVWLQWSVQFLAVPVQSPESRFCRSKFLVKAIIISRLHSEKNLVAWKHTTKLSWLHIHHLASVVSTALHSLICTCISFYITVHPHEMGIKNYSKLATQNYTSWLLDTSQLMALSFRPKMENEWHKYWLAGKVKNCFSRNINILENQFLTLINLIN